MSVTPFSRTDRVELWEMIGRYPKGSTYSEVDLRRYELTVKMLEAEVSRLRKALWALRYRPWTDGAPGLDAYVKDMVVSGQAQMDPEDELELAEHMREASYGTEAEG